MGLFVKLGIVEKFCALGAIAILTDYFLQLTLFLGVFVYDERRREAGRLDCLCCRGGSVASRPRNRTSESTSAILLKTCTRYGNVITSPWCVGVSLASWAAVLSLSTSQLS